LIQVVHTERFVLTKRSIHAEDFNDHHLGPDPGYFKEALTRKERPMKDATLSVYHMTGR